MQEVEHRNTVLSEGAGTVFSVLTTVFFRVALCDLNGGAESPQHAPASEARIRIHVEP